MYYQFDSFKELFISLKKYNLKLLSYYRLFGTVTVYHFNCPSNVCKANNYKN